MVYISKKPVSEKALAIMAEQFVKHIARIVTKKEAEAFLGEMFTPAEKMLYMKRFAILVMLERGYSFGAIKRALKVSQTTIARLQKGLERGEYDQTIKYVERRAKRSKAVEKTFLDFLEIVLQAGLPPRGKGRWQHVWDRVDADGHPGKKHSRR